MADIIMAAISGTDLYTIEDPAAIERMHGWQQAGFHVRVIERKRWSREEAVERLGGPTGMMRPAEEADIAEVISEPTIIVNPAGAPEIVYAQLDPELLRRLRTRLDLHPKWKPNMRSSGVATVSLKFGQRPRTGFRSPKCQTFTLAREAPALHEALLDAGELALPLYRATNSELFDLHAAAVSKIHPAWQWNPLFTSGVANRDSQLPFHYDAGNFRSVWSAMLGLKHQIAGGYLAVPEYGIGLEVADGSLTMFDGQGALHGVTPMRRTRRDGHRYTIVYYGLQGMWHCLDPAEEINRANVLRTAREARRASGERRLTDAQINRVMGRAKYKEDAE